MSILLFSLRGVPEDEADEIRELLTINNVDYYETSAGNWGISMPALWLKSDMELDDAQRLLHNYHQQRAITQRKIYQQLKKDKKQQSGLKTMPEHPLRFFIYLAAIGFIIYLYFGMLSEFGL